MSKHPIRILELRSVWGTGGGPEKTILQGARLADPAQFAVTVCYLRDARDPEFAIGARAAALGVDYVEIGERHSLDPRVWRELRQLVRKRAIDIVHSHDYKTDLLALLLARAEGVIPLATAHGWTGQSWREKLYYVADKRLLGRFPRVIAVSNEIKQELEQCGLDGSRIQVVLNGIDPGQFCREPGQVGRLREALGLDPGDFVIGSVGRLEPQKRFDLLLEAFKVVKDQHPRARLLIAGEGACRPQLETQMRELHLEETCRLLGHRSDVTELHHAFDLFVQSSDYEGTPNAVLEAMALETPIVATAAGGTGDLMTDGVHALLVPRGEPEALARAIEQCLADPAGTGRRTAAARRRVEEDLSFDVRMKTVHAIYEALVHERDFRRSNNKQ